MFKILQQNSSAASLTRHPLARRAGVTLLILLCGGIAASTRAQTPGFTEIYNSGVLTLGADETLRLTIVNNNNVADPALPNFSTPEESCSFVAQFLDGNGNVLQKQQQSLPPGQNFSFSQSGQATVQARVDISPGAAGAFARLIADQCVVSDEILNTSSSDPVLFAPLHKTQTLKSEKTCIHDCAKFCAEHRELPVFGCLSFCKPNC